MAKWCIIILLCILASFKTAIAGSSCVCLFKGQMFNIGDTACIMGSRRQCGMRLNNTSWIEIPGGCDEDKLSALSTPGTIKPVAFAAGYARSRSSKGICESANPWRATASLDVVEINP